MEQKEALRALQDADLIILRARKRYDGLAERKQLSEVQEKTHEVLLKSGQVSDLKSECEDSIKKAQFEDDTLKDKIASMKEKLDNTSDHRVINSLNKEMEGSVKRREKVDFQMNELLERLEKIEGVEKQVKAADAKLGANKVALIEKIREQAEEMKSEVTEAQARRAEAVSCLSPELIDKYRHLGQTKGGIAVSSYENHRCSACNVELHEKERQQIESGPEISTCPRCGRLLIRDDPKEDAK